MTNMLIAAVGAGAAVAGLVLYLGRKTRKNNKVIGAGQKGTRLTNNENGHLLRPAYHAVG